MSESAACSGVIEVEFAVGGVIGVEGHAEETLLAASGGHAGGEACNRDEWGGVEGIGVQVEDSHRALPLLPCSTIKRWLLSPGGAVTKMGLPRPVCNRMAYMGMSAWRDGRAETAKA